MSNSNFEAFKLERNVVRVRPLSEDASEVGYWLTQPAERRIQAIEFLRESFHGHAYPAQGLERVLAVTHRT